MSLGSLSVTSATVPSLSLIPAFAPAIHDYYVRCVGHPGGSAANSLSIAATGASGQLVQVALETPGGGLVPATAPASSQALTLSVQNDQAIVVSPAADGGGSGVAYWVRCLSDDMPEMVWTLRDGGAARTPGYYLWGTMSLPEGPRGGLPQESAYAIVLDTNGVPVWYAYDNSFAAYDVESLAPGEVSFSGPWQVDTLGGGAVYPVADNAADAGGTSTPDEHELRLLPSGHYLALSSQAEYVDLTGLSVPNSAGGTTTYGPNTPIYGCYVQEFDAAGTLYWEWSATDHFDSVTAMVVKGDGDLAGTEAEPYHCNAIDVDPANGNLLVSARNMASVFYVEKATGKVLWVLGALPEGGCKDDAVYIRPDDPFVAQHDARLQPGWTETCGGGAGRISLFDDESYTANPARAVVYDVTIAGGCDGGASTGGVTGATRVFQYKNPFDGGVPTHVCGGFRIAADGSRVIGWGQSEPNPNGLVFSEVDADGNDLVDLVCPDKSSSYRAVKVPLENFDLEVLRATAGE